MPTIAMGYLTMRLAQDSEKWHPLRPGDEKPAETTSFRRISLGRDRRGEV